MTTAQWENADKKDGEKSLQINFLLFWKKLPNVG
jgi:hypothetical protein